jgi:hypothetical protein
MGSWSLAIPERAARAEVQRLGASGFTLAVDRPGRVVVKVRWTPYWAIAAGRGCVEPGPDGWTRVDTKTGGPLRVDARFSAERVIRRGRRCSGD